ncbi:MAG: metallophosphoesterase family protein [Rhodoferax sp.]|jgi:putative phosphoesterase|nr:metallophosphoesterase family protein [Rhodoferax sp.]
MLRIGVISDTHNLLRPEATSFLRGCDHILHAGDVCGSEVLDALRTIAPLTVVRGNNDRGEWAHGIARTELVALGGVYFHIVHDIADLDIDPVAVGVRVVVSGHSHQPSILERQGVLYLNPGSAGPRRFKLPVTAAEVVVEGTSVVARTQLLVDPATGAR